MKKIFVLFSLLLSSIILSGQQISKKTSTSSNTTNTFLNYLKQQLPAVNIVQDTPTPTPYSLSIYNDPKLVTNKPRYPSPWLLESSQLFAGISNNFQTRIACDGSQSTIFRLGGLFVQHPEKFSFKLKDESNDTKNGKLSDIVNGQYSVSMKYTHPTYFAGDDLTKKDYNINLEVYDDGNILTTIPIKIVRPPIIMVGGIFGSQETFKQMDDQLISANLYDPIQIYRLYYKSDEKLDLNVYYWLRPQICQELLRCVGDKISAGKVDIVCHSMGGLISRSYLQGTWYLNDVNKLITLNTPHSGSQITNLLLCPNKVIRKTLRTITQAIMGGDTEAGAAEDMLVDGDRIRRLTLEAAKNKVPVHVLSSTLDEAKIKEVINLADDVADGTREFLPQLSYVIKAITFFTGRTLEFFHQLYIDEEHDTAVPISSQLGGLSGGSINTYLNILHAGAANNPTMIGQVKVLLNSPPDGPLFATGTMHPPTLIAPDVLLSHSGINSQFNDQKFSNPGPSISKKQQDTSKISIISPAAGSLVSPGSVLTIEVSGSTNIKTIQLIAGNSKISSFSQDQTGPSNTFQYKVPQTAIGRVNVIAVGFNENGMVDIDTSFYLNVNPTSYLSSIKVYPTLPILSKGTSYNLTIYGVYEDQIERNITDLGGISIVSKNNTISYLNSGKIRGLAVGDDSIIVSYSGKTLILPIKVLDYQFKGNGLLVSPKIVLQGPYSSSTGMMTDSLRAKSLLPLYIEPYNLLGYTSTNNSTAELPIEGVFDTVGNKAITDWIFLELRDSTNPSIIAATRSALIRRDGNVVDMDGVSPVYFNYILPGEYFVAIKHRNHLGVMTASAISLNTTTTTVIDFTSPATATYGTNAQKNINGVMAMWAGDVNGDGVIKYNGASNDKVLILQKIGVANPNTILNIYDAADINMDGTIKYNGATNDKTIILSNVGVSTPNNIITQQLPH
jgi:pimeloyl-ACP methyl ester carboxylesterase